MGHHQMGADGPTCHKHSFARQQERSVTCAGLTVPPPALLGTSASYCGGSWQHRRSGAGPLPKRFSPSGAPVWFILLYLLGFTVTDGERRSPWVLASRMRVPWQM